MPSHFLLRAFLFYPFGNMATVYARVMELQESNKFPFQFSSLRIIKVGYLIKSEWRKEHNIPLPYIESIEKKGTYLVASYPDFFIPVMDDVIFNYVKRVEEKRKKYWENQRLISSSVSLVSPPKKRKRIALRAPEYSAKTNKFSKL